MTVPLLEVEHLFKSFDGVDAVRDVSFSLQPGEIVAMIGPNGAGKTTCFNLIHGELSPDAGAIRLQGRSIVGLPTHAIAHRDMGRTFQIPATFASMTVAESIALALAAAANADASMHAMLGTPEHAFLAELGIADLAAAHCAALSHGDAKRVELALALVRRPRLLLMDEPTAGMAPRSRRELMQRAIDLAHARGAAVLFTEHDMDIVFGFARRVIVLNLGAVLADGPPAEIQARDDVRAAYLGQ